MSPFDVRVYGLRSLEGSPMLLKAHCAGQNASNFPEGDSNTERELRTA